MGICITKIKEQKKKKEKNNTVAKSSTRMEARDEVIVMAVKSCPRQRSKNLWSEYQIFFAESVSVFQHPY